MGNVSKTEQYFDHLWRERVERDGNIRDKVLSSTTKDEIHRYCMDLEREYLSKAFPNSVRIYNQLGSEQAKEKFNAAFSNIITELGHQKNGTFSHYNDCKDFLDSVNGALIARDEGVDWKTLVQLFKKAYEGRYSPFTAHENNAYVHLWNEFAGIAGLEVPFESSNSNKK